MGMDDLSIIRNIDEECISSALLVFNHARSALIQLSQIVETQAIEIDFLLLERNAILTLVDLYSTSLTTADRPFDLVSSVSSHSISRKKISSGAEKINFPAKIISSDPKYTRAAFLIDEYLLSTLNDTAAGLNYHSSLSEYAPASRGLLIRSPVIGLTITLPNSAVPIKLKPFAGGINISVPLNAISDDTWTQLRYQAECLYWDPEKRRYSSDGVKIVEVQRTHAVCESSHLTDFVINQNSNLPLPILSTSSLPAIVEEFSFEKMLLVIGNKSAAIAMAKMPWRATNISLNQSNYALSLAIRYSGGFGVPCTLAVPFLVLPGLILSTVVGAVYPSDFALAVETSMPSTFDLQGKQLSSAVAKFPAVLGTFSNQVPVEISSFPLSSGRRVSSCINGAEWRLQRLGVFTNTDCSCEANSLCSGETVCKSKLNSGERWAVAAVNITDCTGVSGSNDSALAIGLGLGLGLGLPLITGIAYAALVYNKPKTADLAEDVQNTQQQQQPSEMGQDAALPVAPPALQEHLVYIHEGAEAPVVHQAWTLPPLTTIGVERVWC
jgi:hypothetical protein